MKRYNLYDQHDQKIGEVWATSPEDAVEKSLALYPEAVSAELHNGS